MPAPLAKPDDEEEATMLPVRIENIENPTILNDKNEMILYTPDDNYGLSKKAITTQVFMIFYLYTIYRLEKVKVPLYICLWSMLVTNYIINITNNNIMKTNKYCC